MIKRLAFATIFIFFALALNGQQTGTRINAPNLPVRAPVSVASSHENEAILVALRHSVRDDHTRVVLEFSEDVTYSTEFKGNIFQLSISGCRNLVPSNKSNPVGRDLEEMLINSGPNRSGLILTFRLKQDKGMPMVESIPAPFRLIISLPASMQSVDSLGASKLVSQGAVAAKGDGSKATGAVEGGAKEEIAEEPIPEINIEVLMAKLENEEFLQRTILIDAGHGSTDLGAVGARGLNEKQINLSVAQKLAERLKQMGFKVSLLRNSDISLSHDQRIGLANKLGGDLYISVHTGFSKDPSKHGVGCYYFDAEGHYSDRRASGATYDAVFNEWLKNSRLDLSLFMAKKVEQRLTQHLNTKSRGVIGLPFSALKFIMVPAVMVEVGMLSDSMDGKNLQSDKYHLAIAQAIANGVVDFFNGIVIRTE